MKKIKEISEVFVLIMSFTIIILHIACTSTKSKIEENIKQLKTLKCEIRQ